MTGYHHGRGKGFIEQSIAGLHAALDRALYAENTAAASGLMQQLDPRVKVAGIFSLLLVSASASRLPIVAIVLSIATALALFSRVSPWVLTTRLWLTTLPFSLALALPAVFLTPGRPIYRFPLTNWELSAQGVRTAGMLVLRAETAASLALLLVFTTPWTHVLKALRLFRVPVVFVVILGMTCRYIVLLLEAAHEMFESRKSRTVNFLTRRDQRRIAAMSTGALLTRTLHLSNEVYLAMQSRGFRGEVYIMDDFKMQPPDWCALIAFGGVGVTLAWAGR